MGGAGMNERDLGTPGPETRCSVHELEPRPFESGEFCRDVFRGEGDVVEPLPALLQESGHGAFWSEGDDELNRGPGKSEEADSRARGGDVLGGLRGEPEEPVPGEGRGEISDRDAHMVDRVDHASALGR